MSPDEIIAAQQRELAALHNEITRLRAALAEAERDAARYRFACARGLILINGLPTNIGYSKDRGDAAIDAAMAWEE